MYDVVKVKWYTFLIYFIAYIIMHGMILMLYNKQLELKTVNQKTIKILKFLSDWFPAVYVFCLLVSFYTV